jgi:hypothetical protein
MITTPRISERPPPDTLRSRAALAQGQGVPPSRVHVPAAPFVAPTAPVAETSPTSDVDPLAQTTAVDSVRLPSPETTRTPGRPARDEPAETRRGLDRQALSQRRNALPSWAVVLVAVLVGTLIGVVLYLRLR